MSSLEEDRCEDNRRKRNNPIIFVDFHGDSMRGRHSKQKRNTHQSTKTNAHHKIDVALLIPCHIAVHDGRSWEKNKCQSIAVVNLHNQKWVVAGQKGRYNNLIKIL